MTRCQLAAYAEIAVQLAASAAVRKEVYRQYIEDRTGAARYTDVMRWPAEVPDPEYGRAAS